MTLGDGIAVAAMFGFFTVFVVLMYLNGGRR